MRESKNRSGAGTCGELGLHSRVYAPEIHDFGDVGEVVRGAHQVADVPAVAAGKDRDAHEDGVGRGSCGTLKERDD